MFLLKLHKEIELILKTIDDSNDPKSTFLVKTTESLKLFNEIQIINYKRELLQSYKQEIDEIYALFMEMYREQMQLFLSKHQSHPYNPCIAKTFFLANMIEAWGTGIAKMKEDCENHGVPKPKIFGSKTDICVEFKNHEADIEKAVDKGKTPMKTPIETPIEIIKILAINSSITIPELADEIGKSESATWRAIKKLQKEDRIKRIGSTKKGYWKIIRKARGSPK